MEFDAFHSDEYRRATLLSRTLLDEEILLEEDEDGYAELVEIWLELRLDEEKRFTELVDISLELA